MEQFSLIPELGPQPVPEKKASPEQDLSLKEQRLRAAVEEFLAARTGPGEKDRKTRKETERGITPRDVSLVYARLLREEEKLRTEKRMSVKDAEALHVTEGMIRSFLRKQGVRVPYSEKELRDRVVLPEQPKRIPAPKKVLRAAKKSQPKTHSKIEEGNLF